MKIIMDIDLKKEFNIEIKTNKINIDLNNLQKEETNKKISIKSKTHTK
jgi:hypothetical protein